MLELLEECWYDTAYITILRDWCEDQGHPYLEVLDWILKGKAALQIDIRVPKNLRPGNLADAYPINLFLQPRLREKLEGLIRSEELIEVRWTYTPSGLLAVKPTGDFISVSWAEPEQQRLLDKQQEATKKYDGWMRISAWTVKEVLDLVSQREQVNAGSD